MWQIPMRPMLTQPTASDPSPAPMASAPVNLALTSYGQLAGRWRRSLIAWPDGRQDTTTTVDWLQALTCFVDLRQPIARPDFSGVGCLRDLRPPHLEWLSRQEGFAGVTRPGVDAGGDYLEWLRAVDYTPADTPDAGRLRYVGDDIDALIEGGLAGEYVEYWHRDPATAGPCWGRLLRGGSAGDQAAVLVRVGAVFGFARSRAKPLPPGARLPELVAADPGAPAGAVAELIDCEISLGMIDSGRWTITRSSLPFREGSDLAVECEPSGELVWTGDVAVDGVPIRRCWGVEFAEGLGAAGEASG